MLTRGKRDRKRADNDDDEYDDPDDDVSDIYSRLVSGQRVFVKRARARVCHLVVVSLGRDARCNRDRKASLPLSLLRRERLRLFIRQILRLYFVFDFFHVERQEERPMCCC